MSATRILHEALAVVRRDHTAIQLAADERGAKVRNPIAPAAAAWSSVGALIKVAPRNPGIVAEHKSPGHIGDAWEAFLLLEEAAVLQGYANTVEVDRAGRAAAVVMFEKALQLAPDEPRRNPARTGSSPKGIAA